jgi:hypothetical protein
MRLIIVLLLGVVLGWLAGSLYPAPQAWLAALHLDAVQRRPSGEAQPPPAPSSPDASSLTPASASASNATPTAPRASATGPVDEQTLNQYRNWIDEARATHPYADSADRMYAVMMCESRGQAGIVNPAGPYSGLFQYSSATWNGAWNQYRNQSILDARAQIFATALAWRNNMQGQWGCYSRPH